MLFIVTSILALFIIGSSQSLIPATTLPDDFVFIAPNSSVPYPINSTVTIGVVTDAIEGIQQSYLYSVLLPNGTSFPWGSLYTGRGSPGDGPDCVSLGGPSTATFDRTHQGGVYMVSWNITYAYPSNPTSNSCGANSTYTYQNWVVNDTFLISSSSTQAGGTVPSITVTTPLASAPTGTVISLSIGAALPGKSVQALGVVGTLSAALLLLL